MLIVVLLAIICVTSIILSACGDTPESDREVLVTLYNATNGPDWRHNDNWLSDKPIGEWDGVITENGRVVVLNLSWNELSGEIPPELGRLSNLKVLWLDDNELSGRIPSELGKLANLESLSLSFNELCGEIPSEWDELHKDQLSEWGESLELPPCWHTPESDREVLITLYNATNGPSWDSNENWLSDKPIGEWDGVTAVNDRVVALDLGFEGLSGEIPPELGKLFSLERLSLWDNNLSGEIPPELGKLFSLERLSLWDNNLSGEIPPELSELSNLEELNLRENELTGEIPPELGNLSKLETLWLNYNKLSGEIPPELGKLSELNSLYIAGGNRLAGCIPRLLHYARSNDLSELPLADC